MEPLPREALVCALCGVTEPFDLASDPESGWAPFFYDETTGTEHGPACPTCVALHGIHYVFDGETGSYVKRGVA